MANNGRGKKHSWRTGGEFKSGKNHIFYGKKRPEHSAKLKNRKRGRNKNTIIVIRECSYCKKIIEALNSRIKSKNIFCDMRCRNKFKVGINAVNYIHGEGYSPYDATFSNIKDVVRKRDNYICQNCNMTEEEHIIVYGEVLSVHHIDYNKRNSILENLITLCRNCNTRANFNREYWINYYKNKLNEVIKT